MSQMLEPISKVLDEAKRIEEMCSDEVVSLKSLLMDVEEPGRMVIKRGTSKPESFDILDHCYQQMSNVIYGLPGGYLSKLVELDAADLAARNFNHWVKHNKDREIFLRFIERGASKVIRGILPSSWNEIPYTKALQTIIDRYGSDIPVNVRRFDDIGLTVDITLGKFDRQVVVGDAVEYGVRYADSDIGYMNAKCSILPYTFRLICTNGAVSMRKGSALQIGHTGKESNDLGLVLASLRQNFDMVVAYSKSLMDVMNKAHTIKLDDPQETMNRLTKQFILTKLQDKYVRIGWDSEKDLGDTVYRLSNAYTRAGNETELKLEARFQLQNVGGTVLDLVNSNWRWN